VCRNGIIRLGGDDTDVTPDPGITDDRFIRGACHLRSAIPFLHFTAAAADYRPLEWQLRYLIIPLDRMIADYGGLDCSEIERVAESLQRLHAVAVYGSLMMHDMKLIQTKATASYTKYSDLCQTKSTVSTQRTTELKRRELKARTASELPVRVAEFDKSLTSLQALAAELHVPPAEGPVTARPSCARRTAWASWAGGAAGGRGGGAVGGGGDAGGGGGAGVGAGAGDGEAGDGAAGGGAAAGDAAGGGPAAAALGSGAGAGAGAGSAGVRGAGGAAGAAGTGEMSIAEGKRPAEAEPGPRAAAPPAAHAAPAALAPAPGTGILASPNAPGSPARSDGDAESSSSSDRFSGSDNEDDNASDSDSGSDSESLSESSTGSEDDSDGDESEGDAEAPAADAHGDERRRLRLTERVETELRDMVIKARALVEDLIMVQIKPATKMLVIKLQDCFCAVSQCVARLPHAGIVAADLRIIFDYICAAAAKMASTTAAIEVLASDGEFANGLRTMTGDTVQSLSKRAGLLADAALVAAKMAAGIPAESMTTKLSVEQTAAVVAGLADTVVREMVPLPPARLREPWVGRAREDEAGNDPAFTVDDMMDVLRAGGGAGTTSLEDKWRPSDMANTPGEMDEVLDVLHRDFGWCSSDGAFVANSGQMIRAWRVQRAAATQAATISDMKEQLQQTLFEKEERKRLLQGEDFNLFSYIPALKEGSFVMEDNPHKKKAFAAHLRKQGAKLKAEVSAGVEAAKAESAERKHQAEIAAHGRPWEAFSKLELQTQFADQAEAAAKPYWTRETVWKKLSEARRERLMAGSHTRSLFSSTGSLILSALLKLRLRDMAPLYQHEGAQFKLAGGLASGANDGESMLNPAEYRGQL